MIGAGLLEAGMGFGALTSAHYGEGPGPDNSVAGDVGEGFGAAFMGAGMGLDGIATTVLGIAQVVSGRRFFATKKDTTPRAAPRPCEPTIERVMGTLQIEAPCQTMIVEGDHTRVFIPELKLSILPDTPRALSLADMMKWRLSGARVTFTRESPEWAEYEVVQMGRREYGLWMRIEIGAASFVCTNEEWHQGFETENDREKAIAICRSLRVHVTGSPSASRISPTTISASR